MSAGETVRWLTSSLPKNGSLAIWVGSFLLLGAGCASLSCQSAVITVAKKEERGRVEASPRGYTSETGGLQELRRPEIVRDYWVQDDAGTWYRVPLEKYRDAMVGQPLEVCR